MFCSLSKWDVFVAPTGGNYSVTSCDTDAALTFVIVPHAEVVLWLCRVTNRSRDELHWDRTTHHFREGGRWMTQETGSSLDRTLCHQSPGCVGWSRGWAEVWFRAFLILSPLMPLLMLKPPVAEEVEQERGWRMRWGIQHHWGACCCGTTVIKISLSEFLACQHWCKDVSTTLHQFQLDERKL